MARITDPKRDPFGAAMWAYLKGNFSAAVKVVSDIAVDDEIPVRYLFRSHAFMPELEQIALDLCQGRVLDIGAGAGSHSLALQQKGLEVTSLDISPGAVEIMRDRGLSKVEHCSLWDYTEGSFDTLFMMMNGIGLVGDLMGLNRFLLSVDQWLAPGGQILLDSSDIRYLFDEGLERTILQYKPYHGIIQYQMSYGDVLGEPFDWLYIDYPRLETHARVFGFQAEKLFEGPHYEYLARLRKK